MIGFNGCLCSFDFFLAFNENNHSHIDTKSFVPCVPSRGAEKTPISERRTIFNQKTLDERLGRQRRDASPSTARLVKTTTLTLADSPYEVTSHVVVPGGVALVVDEGVRLYFERDCGLVVQGEFAGSPSPSKWPAALRHAGGARQRAAPGAADGQGGRERCLGRRGFRDGGQHVAAGVRVAEPCAHGADAARRGRRPPVGRLAD